MAIQEIKVWRTVKDVEGEGLRGEIKKTLGFDKGEIRTKRGYWLEGISRKQAETLTEKLLADPIIQKASFSDSISDKIQPEKDKSHTVAVAYKPGVMDPEAQSIIEAAQILKIKPKAVGTFWEYHFPQKTTQQEIGEITQRLLVNPTVQRVIFERPKTLLISGEAEPTKVIPIGSFSDEQLLNLAQQERSALDLEELQTIKAYAQTNGRDFTDIEIGTVDQTWSEHSGHKTFKRRMIVNGQQKPSLLERIKAVSLKFAEKINSAFEGNAGGIPFYDGWVICAKGETHNWPVGVEPYGGAMTRSGGLFRDPAAFGEGGENLFTFDINCFAPPDFPKELVPRGCLEPTYLLRHNFYGIRDYGNRMGIPTVAADFFFHPDFRARCVSLGVTFGIIPENKSKIKEAKVGQLIISVGGRTGRDGTGGASASSRETTDKTMVIDAVSVQIGNPIEEKRMFDALIECRDSGLIGAITDCGGGGYSSAIGEIGAKVGAEVDLDQVKVKYTGLSVKEIWLSEAQERMIVAADPENIAKMEKIMKKHGVEMTVIGKFTGDKKLILKDDGKVVGDLEMEFLHHGLPKKTLEASWEPPAKDEREPELPTNWEETFKKVLSHWNVCSKEPIVRQYDHGVQGITALSPFTGVHQDVLNDGYVCQPLRGKPYGLVASSSLNPLLNRIDPYWGSVWVVTEALAKLTAVGGNYKEAALIENFIWPKPTKTMLGALDRSVDGLCDSIEKSTDPIVSGKDSLSSTYKSDKETIEIPPVLNISVFGRIPDVAKTTSLDFKKTGSTICLVGDLDSKNLGGSVYFDSQGILGTNMPKIDLEKSLSVFDKIQEGTQLRQILSCHAIDKGGLAVALSKMCFGGDCGAKIDLSKIGEGRPDFLLFSETAGCLLAEFEDEEEAERLLQGVPHVILGKTQEKKEIEVAHQSQPLFAADLYSLKEAWQAPMKKVIQ